MRTTVSIRRIIPAEARPVVVLLSLSLLGFSLPLYAVGVITSQQLADRIQAGSAPFILDVRTAEEFAEGHVPGAVNIPVSDLANRAGEIMPYQQEEIVVYCAVGPRAYFVGMLMEKNGFTGVFDLKGHMHEWVSRGHPIQKAR